MKVNILGQEYEILTLTEEEYPKLKNANACGLFEGYSKQIVINKDTVEDELTYANFKEFKNKTLRHEILHAYFHEMGLRDYCEDETLIDILAFQIPKMTKTFKELSC